MDIEFLRELRRQEALFREQSEINPASEKAEDQEDKVLASAISGDAKIYQENGRWVLFITGLPEWVNLEINRSYMPYDRASPDTAPDYIKFVQESSD